MSIYEQINKVKLSIGKVHKDGKNPHFKSTHLTLAGISEALEPALAENGLMLFQYVRNNYLMTEVRDKADGCVVSEMLLIGTDMQKLGSAITYARRYSIVALFGILDTDDDGEQAVAVSPLTDKQKELIKLLGDDIDLATEIKAKLKITNKVNEMTNTELDKMIVEARKV